MSSSNNFISLLRGINVSGHKKILMAELKDLYQSLGFSNIRTYLQSGNVVFESSLKDKIKIAELISSEINRVFGYSVKVLLINPDDLKRIIDTNPFIITRDENPSHLYVTFLYEEISKLNLENFKLQNKTKDEFEVGEKEIFVFCPNGYGRSKLNNNFFEKRLNVAATTRNWKTVNALYDIFISTQR